MNDLDSSIAEAIDDEALFRLAEGEEHEFSPSYNEAMESLYHKATAHPKRKRGPIGRIVVIAAVIAALTGAATAATFWDEIQQFFVLNFGQYVELQTNPNKEIRKEDFKLIPEEWESFWYPDKLCGYSLGNAKSLANQKIITFIREADSLKFYQWKDGDVVCADDEVKVISDVFIGESQAYTTEKTINGVTYLTLLWSNEETSFKLYGTLKIEQMYEIANSMTYVER